MMRLIFFITLFSLSSLFSNAEVDFLKASLNGDFETVKHLFEREGRSLIHAKDKHDNTPLHLSACSKKGGNKIGLIKFFVEKGADINAANHFLSTPLHLAISTNNMEGAEFLLEQKNILPNQRNNQSFTPLHLATINRSVPLIHLLLSSESLNPNIGTIDGATPLHFASMWGYTQEACALLSDPRIEINAAQHESDFTGATPLHFASMQAYTEIVSLLLKQKNINIHARIKMGPHKGFTPLHFAVMNPEVSNVFETVKLLLQKGSNPHLKSETGATPLHLTNVHVIQTLLKNPNSNYELKK